MNSPEGRIPRGVVVRNLEPHPDSRGELTEAWRAEWSDFPVAQWNAVRSVPGALRGVHVHVHHEDYVTVPIGRAFVGLCDLRREEPTFLHSSLVEIGERNPLAVIIPRGVAHGFFFPEDAVHFYGMSRTFDPNDEIGCRFDDPDLGIEWPRRDVLLSERDERLQSLTQLLEAFEEARLRAEGEG